MSSHLSEAVVPAHPLDVEVRVVGPMEILRDRVDGLEAKVDRVLALLEGRDPPRPDVVTVQDQRLVDAAVKGMPRRG